MKNFVLIDREQTDAKADGLLFFFDTNADGVRSLESGDGSWELADGSADW